MTVHDRLVLVTPVAEIVIELLQRRFVVAPVPLEGDGQVFAGMGVMEGEGAGLVFRGRIMDRAGADHEHQRGEAKQYPALKPALRNRRQFELTCEVNQHGGPTQSTSGQTDSFANPG